MFPQYPNLQFLTHFISNASFKDAIKALPIAVPNNIFNGYGIIGSSIYGDFINYIETGLFKDPLLIQFLMTLIKNNFYTL